MQIVPGRLYARFGVEARLGEGASASVYRVRDRRGGGLRALKVLRAPTQAQRARLAREAGLLAGVEHPNVVGVEGLVAVGGATALVMEYAPGPSLREVMDRGLTPAEVDDIARGLLAGVAALHTAGVVHRDLKPDNVLLTREGARWAPVIVDLGLARSLQPAGSRLTRTGEALGTPAYMAPEQIADSRRAGTAADVWALGVILFELVCGQRPFPGDSLPTVAAAIEAGAPGRRAW